MALLRFDGLSFAYPYASRRTLQDVSFEMAEGEYLVLCGPSGCGKTTLLKQAKRELRPAGSREGKVLYQNTPPLTNWTRKQPFRRSAMFSRIRRTRS